MLSCTFPFTTPLAMKPSLRIVVLFLVLLALATINFCFCNNRSTHLNCIESERQALLKLKQDFVDEPNRLASWSGDGDCCSWAGVICDNFTGHVLELHLHGYPPLRGEINPSLVDLKDLVHLDLSRNYILHIPPFLGSMKKLRYLNLSDGGFSGMIPHQLGNLSNLRYLDLGGGYELYVENLSWLSGLSLMEHLDLTEVDLTKSSDGQLVINHLPLLEVLILSRCQLHHFSPLSIANFSSLTILDLSDNQLGISVPSWIFGLRDLVFLSLSENDFQGPIPNGLQNLTSLRHLDLSSNSFNSSIPDWLHKFSFLEFFSLESSPVSYYDYLPCGKLEGSIPRSWGRLCNLRSLGLSCVKLNQNISEILDIFSGCVSNGLVSLALNRAQVFGHLTDQFGKLKNLVSIDLSDNSIVGYVPDFLGQLSSLEELDLSSNKLEGTISEIHFVNLKRLSTFDVSENSLSLKVSPDWIPPFQLEVLGLRSIHLGSRFPSWLPLQKHLVVLDMSNSTLLDTISIRFWEFFSQLRALNLSHNQIHGGIPNLGEGARLYSLFLHSNSLSGPLPIISRGLYQLNLANNNFSGSIFQFLCSRTYYHELIDLEFLNLKENFLFGELPDCWENFQFLRILDLGNNRFTGNLPTSIGNLDSLQSLHLRRNKLSGPLPMSFRNLTNLKILDISQNEFVGKVPAWIGERFSTMSILNLHSNKFYGVLPVELCQLSSLQILDLADNNFFGTIPGCLNNFSAMVTKQYSIGDRYLIKEINMVENFVEDTRLVMKGKIEEYSTILNLVRIIDLSKNNFSGEIPIVITNLEGLQTLNLSNNFLTGRIPKSIGAMTYIESLDFSGNHLSGEIPSSISNLTFLSHLNLSNNYLTGRIPLSTQLQSLDASCFAGNDLCGDPLPKNCHKTDSMSNHEERGEDGDEHKVNWFYVSMPIGFVVGFWGVIGPLIVNRRWRYKYCHFLDFLGNKLYYFVKKCC